ncbi:MAG: MFS transporter [Clostridiales bacterium]|nr:MFS transporter [Clostridiales bacterium]
METMEKKKWAGPKQVWIALFAGILYFLTGCINAGNSNTVIPMFAEVRGWSMPMMLSFVGYGGYISVILGLVFGQLVLKVGVKKVMVPGLIVGAFSALGFGVTSNFRLFLFFTLLNFAAAAAYQVATINVLITSWFPRRKGIVLGWSTLGLVLANVFWAPYITNVFNLIGTKTTFVIVCIVYILMAVLCVVCVKETPEEAGTYPDNDPEGLEDFASVTAMFDSYESPFTIGRLLKMPQTWQMIFGYGLPWLTMIAFVGQIVPRLISCGYDAMFASTILMLSSVIGLFGSWFLGVLDDRLGTKKASVIMIVALIVMIIIGLFHAQSVVAVWISAVLGGIGTGAMANLMPSMIGTIFGRWDFKAANRLIFPLVNLLPSAGMSLVGIILAQGLGYNQLYVVCIVLNIIGLILILTLKDQMIGKKDVSAPAEK